MNTNINMESRFHPHYELIKRMKKLFPDESEKWEKLLRDVRDSSKRGCFTCRFYNYPQNEFVDVEEVDGYEIPWDTEEAYVDCNECSQEAQSPLRIECPLWKIVVCRKCGEESGHQGK